MSIMALTTAFAQLCDIADKLGSSFPPPYVVAKGDGFVDRHEPRARTNGLACYLKAVKLCSTLNGAVILLNSGHVQEAFALGRIAEDQVEDIHFLVRPRGDDGRLSAHQEAALAEFFQEELKDVMDPVGTSQERYRIRRDKIRAAIHSDMDDPSTVQKITKAFHRLFSGYVYGAYVHIMELHSEGAPGHYHARGTPGPRLTEAIDYFPHFIYHAVLAVEDLVDRSSRDDLLPQIRSLRAHLPNVFDLLP